LLLPSQDGENSDGDKGDACKQLVSVTNQPDYQSHDSGGKNEKENFDDNDNYDKAYYQKN